MSKQLLNTQQLAGLLNIKPRTIYTLVQTNQIPCIKIGRILRFQASEVIEHLKARSETDSKIDQINNLSSVANKKGTDL